MDITDKKQHIFDEAAKRGFEVTVRNMAYSLLRVYFNDPLLAYAVIMGGAPANDSDVDDYDGMEQVRFLTEYFNNEFMASSDSDNEMNKAVQASIKKRKLGDDSMTFEENRAGIEQQIKEVLELKKQLYGDDGICTDVKTMATLQKTEMDARAKLNDKFGAAENTSEERIVVLPRCNHICEWTNRECWLQTKEYAMEHWHLIEDPKYNKAK